MDEDLIRVEPGDDPSRVLGTPLVRRAARWGIVAWTAIGVLILGYFLLRYVVYPIRVIFPPLVVALIGVYLLNPIVSALERRGIARVWGTLVTYLIGIAIVGTAMVFAIPVVSDQVEAFAKSAPNLLDRASQWIQDVTGRFGFNLGGGGAETDVVGFLGSLLSVTRPILDAVLVLILGPILAFYLLVDLPKIKRGLKTLVPTRRRHEVESVTDRIGQAVGGFFRGQLLVSLFVGIASAIVLFVVGLPFWALVGLVVGLFNLIPLIGPFIGIIVAVLIAFTTQEAAQGLIDLAPGLPLALGSTIALLIVQQIDNHILSPNIVARTVRLHPVTVMLGLLAGGTLLGLWGMLLAVPTLATVKILLLHAWDTQMQWPPRPSGEHTVVAGPESSAGLVPSAPVQGGAKTAKRASEQVRETERRGSWWHNAFRFVGGRPRTSVEPPARETREPERTTPGS